MLLNAATFQGCVFTISELLREKQHGERINLTPFPHPDQG